MAHQSLQTTDAPTTSTLDWRRVAAVCAMVAAAGHVVIGAAYRDLDPFGIAVSFLIALGVLRLRRGTVGLILIGLAFVNVAFWTVPAVLTSLGGRSGFTAVAVPGVVAVLALTGVTATVAAFATRDDEVGATVAPQRVIAAAGVAAAIVLGAALVAGGGAVEARPGDLVVLSDRTAFSVTELVAEAGTIGVHMDNLDYFWHTFTLAELGVDLRVPVGASGRVTFEAAPGTYEFFCAIPGHDVAGMVGTLAVLDG